MRIKQELAEIDMPLDEGRLRRIGEFIKSILGEPELTGSRYKLTHDGAGNLVRISLNRPSSPEPYAFRVRVLSGLSGVYSEHQWHPVVPESASTQVVTRRGIESEEIHRGFSNNDLDEIASNVGFKEENDG